MTINIQEHMLVPKHEIMTDSEIEDLKNSADYDIENLPRIKVDDPVVKDIDAKEKDIKYYESKGCKLNQDINSCVTIPNSSGWKLPLTSAWVTSEYQVVRTDCIGCGGVSHRGIDLGASEGTYAYAAAKG